MKNIYEGEIKVKDLSQIIDEIRTIGDDAKITFDKQGIHCTIVDPAHVGMIALDYDKDGFETYDLDETVEVGLETQKIAGFLALLNNKDIVGMKIGGQYDDDDNFIPTKLVFDCGNLHRKMPFLNVEGMTDPNIPELNVPNMVKIKAKEWLKGVKACNNISEQIIVETVGKKLVIRTDEDEDSVDMEISELEHESIDTDGSSIFSLDFINTYAKVYSADMVLTVHTGTNYPIIIEHGFGKPDDDDKDDLHGYVKQFLAPRIESTGGSEEEITDGEEENTEEEESEEE